MAKTREELEVLCRQIGHAIGRNAGPQHVFLLFLADVGQGGNTAYVSNAHRDDAIKLVTDWLDRQDMNAGAASLRMLMESAGHLIYTLADAVGFTYSDEIDPVALVDWCKGLRARAQKAVN